MKYVEFFVLYFMFYITLLILEHYGYDPQNTFMAMVLAYLIQIKEDGRSDE